MPRSPVVLVLAALAASPALAQQPIPPVQEALKEFTAERGFFTVWRKDHQVYLEVPGNLLDQPFLLATSIAGGPQYAGFQWGTTVCAWQRLDRKLLLVEREVRYRVRDQRKPVSEVVKRTYTDRLLHAAPIVALNGQNPVIDLVGLCAGQAQVFFGPLASGLDAGVVQVAKLKPFPQNLELGLTLPDKQREGRFTTLAYSFSALPPPNYDRYQPRVADDRVGYFLTAAKDFTDEVERGDRFVRWIHRWKLEKLDGSLPRSPVREPIVFYVEDTVPYRFRQAVAEGILEWNRAFEAIGLQSVMVVRQQTDTEFQDLDPEDVRYNFFRWIVSERSFAMGPSRVNPWTGQILDADIVFDESMVRVYLRNYEREIKEGPKRAFSPRMQALLEQDPLRYGFAHGEGPADEAGPADFACGPDQTSCGLGTGLSHELGLAALALDLLSAQGGGEYPHEFMAAVVKDVVMHEVGHTLGLRHNFKASTWRQLGEINSAARPADVCASVMDYNPVNVVPPGGTQGEHTNRTIGPYDLWAIKYGYEMVPDEASGLAATVASVASPQYAYATDEDTSGPDPTATRWDLGQDPLEFAAQRIELSRALLGTIVDRVVPKGAAWGEARHAVDMLLAEQQRAGLMAARWVGGQVISRHHRGDAGAADPVTPVPAARQRRALQLVCEQLLEAGNLDLPADLLRQLGKEHWRHWGAAGMQASHAYGYYERLEAIQRWALFALLNPDTLQRLIDNEALSSEDDRLSVGEVLDKVSLAVMGDLLLPGPLAAPTGGKPAVPTAQRALQRCYVDELIAMQGEAQGGATPVTARNLARLELQRLLSALEQEQPQQLDAETRAHLQDLTLRMKKAQEAQWTQPGPFGRGAARVRLAGEGE